MRGLSFLGRTNVRGNWVLASYHDPQSLTWSWAVYFDTSNVGNCWFYNNSMTAQRETSFGVPHLFVIRIKRQDKMPVSP